MTHNSQNESRVLADTVIEGIRQKKGYEIVSLDFENVPNAICKYFIICHGTSKTQVEAIADSVTELVRKNVGSKPWHVEGFENAEWILLDYVDIVVHVFQQETRSFFQLEDLWADAKIVTIDDN